MYLNSNTASSIPLFSHQFDLREQELFASLSGDFNPIHLDQVASRRLMYGHIVVHGIHLTLKGIDQFIEKRN